MKEWVGKRKKECEAIIHESESSPLAVMEANMQLPLIAEIERLEKDNKAVWLTWEGCDAERVKLRAVVEAAKAYVLLRLSDEPLTIENQMERSEAWDKLVDVVKNGEK